MIKEHFWDVNSGQGANSSQLGVREEFAPQHSQGDSGDTAVPAEHPLFGGILLQSWIYRRHFQVILRKHNFISFRSDTKNFLLSEQFFFSLNMREKSLSPIRESGKRVQWVEAEMLCAEHSPSSQVEGRVWMSVPVTAPKLPLINMFICPLLVFIINYVVFPLPSVVQNAAPGIITLYSPPK